MQAIPRISELSAALISILAAYCFYLAYVVFRSRRQSPYPNIDVSLVCVFIGIWLLINAWVDRTAGPTIGLWLGRLSWVVPSFVLFFFTRFALQFPPPTKRIISSAVLFGTIILFLLNAIISLHPSGLILTFDSDLQRLQSATNHFYYFVVMSTYLISIVSMVAIFLAKWRHTSRQDRLPLKIILGGFLISSTLAILFSILESYNRSEAHYYYIFSSLAVMFFAFAFSYTILKHGALKNWITISRSMVFGAIIAAIALAILTSLAS